MNYTRERINRAVSKVFTLQQRYGTISGRLALSAHGVAPDMHGFITDLDVQIIARAIKTGIIKNTAMRQPQSRDTLGFVIMFKDLAEKAAASIDAEFEAEITAMWVRMFDKHGIQGAKAEVARLWGENLYMDNQTRSLYNSAYIAAKKRWETTD